MLTRYQMADLCSLECLHPWSCPAAIVVTRSTLFLWTALLSGISVRCPRRVRFRPGLSSSGLGAAAGWEGFGRAREEDGPASTEEDSPCSDEESDADPKFGILYNSVLGMAQVG